MEEFDDIPASLRRDLKAAMPRLEIPAGRDAAIKAAARPLQRQRRMVWRSLAFIGAAAAVIAITLILLVTHDWSDGGTNKNIAAVPNDMNADGQVDIRDGLILAQKTKGGKSIAAPWNQSITLTEADVKNIGAAIVALPPTGNAVAAEPGAHLATLAPEIGRGVAR